MLVSNWFNYVQRNLGVSVSEKPITSTGQATYKALDYDKIFFGTDYLKQSTTGVSDGVRFGSGTTAPSMSDYKLESAISYSVLGVTQTVTASAEGNTITKTAVFTITNNDSSDITISEIGYFGGNSGMYLLDRTLLDEPVTIPVGGVGQVTYTVTFNIA